MIFDLKYKKKINFKIKKINNNLFYIKKSKKHKKMQFKNFLIQIILISKIYCGIFDSYYVKKN